MRDTERAIDFHGDRLLGSGHCGLPANESQLKAEALRPDGFADAPRDGRSSLPTWSPPCGARHYSFNRVRIAWRLSRYSGKALRASLDSAAM